MEDIKQSRSKKHGSIESPDCSDTSLFNQLEADINTLDLTESTAFDVEQLVIKFAYLECSGNAQPPLQKKRKGKRLASNKFVQSLDLKFKKHASKLVRTFRKRADGDCSLLSTFLELDADYQQKFFKLSELYRLLDDRQHLEDCSRDPEINILKVKHLFLDELFSRENTNISKIICHCLHEARYDKLSIKTASAILGRLNEAALIFVDQRKDSCQPSDIVVSSAISYASKLTLPLQVGFLNMAEAVISKEMKLVEGFSLEVKEKIRMSFLDALLCDSNLEQLLKHHVSQYQDSKSVICNELKQLFQIAKAKERLQEFALALITGACDAFAEAINSRVGFNGLLNLKAFQSEVFRCLFHGSDFGEISDKMWSYFEASDLHQTSLKLYIKVLNSFFNKACSSPSKVTDISVNALIGFIEFYRFGKGFTPIYLQQCLLRRAVRKGYSFLRVFCDRKKFCIERDFCETLITEGAPHSELLNNTLRCLNSSHNMCLKNRDKDCKIEPIVIGMNEMKSIFKAPISGIPQLPQEMQAMWESQIVLYQEAVVESTVPKKLTLVPTLNNIELSTPFVLENSCPLVLEVNLLQAVVLDAFNDGTDQTFQELKDSLKFGNDDLLSIAVGSYVKASILLQEKNTFTLNQLFKPEKSVLRGNKLRVDF
ncbi:KLTH0H11198p [Lachancea thermotolerans CBS 6340]|uniref:KLTH0H11198p n=1 Tax=Lachancea thermotolerans (strain ATCC 56472 / CBS 6340 / NRRL Y-8284) TaxID=559295 RepID=C5E385_LACTC|nr:KLTH0H11198p [Lachancea thermotolerans CBS 6340]CAR30496.1 KLTH0H11198p [Lachancea thermotolerans CBS 6340]